MIPVSSKYPDEFDGEDNLYLVHDSIRFRLSDDYNPGDTSIKIEGDFVATARLPASGLITLTEQCSDLDERAVSFFYSSFDANTSVISGLEILPGFPDVKKPKRITNVTVNVMAEHHNNIKDALIAIQEFLGVKGTEDIQPFGETMEGRINFLRKVVLQPKAWFTANTRTGNVPLEVEFNNLSFRLGTDGTEDDVEVTWDFGDQTTSVISLISTINASTQVPDDAVDVYVKDEDSGKIKKIYHKPGIYDVKLTVKNNFGTDVITLPDFINARTKAPNQAIIRLIENTSNQAANPGVPPNGPFETTPTIRSPVNTLIQLEVEQGENPATPNYSYGGEFLNEYNQSVDPIVVYTWFLGDDLDHANSSQTQASYSVGGIYDLKLRVDTEFGAYRITTYENAIDIIENQNLWLWLYQTSTTVAAYEYGLISETFKISNAPSYTLDIDESFLDNAPNSTQQKREFNKNTGFAPTSTIGSGLGGTVLLYWASGRAESDPPSSETINIVEFDGFSGTYLTKSPITRQWNWLNLNSPQASFFVFGCMPSYIPNSSPTNVVKASLDLNSLSISTSALTADNYLNGASELTQNVSTYDNSGSPIYGNFSVYRSGWKDNTGYFARNDGVGPFFRIKSFYRTEGTTGSPFINIRKLQDIQGPTKLEGELVDLSKGMYFLNNSGSISQFDVEASIWHTGGPGVNSLLYRSLQDTSVAGFDSNTNTMLLTSDKDKRAYLSFDYSPNAFLKFSEIDLVYTQLGSRPAGQQWILGVY